MKTCFLYYVLFFCVLLSCEREKPVSGDDTYQETDCDCDDLGNDENVTFIIRGNDFYLRARQFSPEYDMVWKLQREKGFHNKYFNISGMYTCPKAASDEETISSLTLWKDSSDDLCPVNVMGTYIGGNHGYDCVDKLKCTAHGKTNSDIGSVWTDSEGKTYVLTHIYDSNYLGFVMFNDLNMSQGKMSYGNPAVGTQMKHVKGALNQASIEIEARSGAQLWQCFNRYFLTVSIDGRQISPTKDGIYDGDRVEIETRYNIIYIPAMLTYLMENVGRNNADSQHSEAIENHYMKVYVSYEFNRNGSVSTYCSYDINKYLTMGYFGLVQSMAVSAATYTYVPDTVCDMPSLHDGNELKLTKDLWRSEQKAPYRYYQFSDSELDKGVCLAYDRSIGLGQNDIRLEQLEYAGKYSKAQKMYPCLISGGALRRDNFYDAMAVRIPLYKYDQDMTAVAWYWNGDDIILMLDTHKSVTKDLTLPKYMDNMKIDVLDRSSNVVFEQAYVRECKLRLSTSDYGYLVLKLYKCH